MAWLTSSTKSSRTLPAMTVISQAWGLIPEGAQRAASITRSRASLGGISGLYIRWLRR